MNGVRPHSGRKALGYAFLLLKYRQRSEQEIRSRMARKKFAADDIDETVGFLKEKRFIDDAGFARAWVASRLARGVGASRVKNELRLKGISLAIVQEALRELPENYSEDAAMASLVEKKLRQYGGVEPAKKKQRIYAFLIRRGFCPDAVADIVNGIE